MSFLWKLSFVLNNFISEQQKKYYKVLFSNFQQSFSNIQINQHKMSNQMLSVFVCVLAFCIALSSCNYANPDAAGCQPGVVEDMPPHIRRVCSALENSEQLASALKTYISRELGPIQMNINGLTPNNEKRTDVDHVFLRFGKRR